MQDNVIHHVWIHFIPTSLYPRRRKTFGWSWNQTQALLLHVHKRPLYSLDLGSSGVCCRKLTTEPSLFCWLSSFCWKPNIKHKVGVHRVKRRCKKLWSGQLRQIDWFLTMLDVLGLSQGRDEDLVAGASSWSWIHGPVGTRSWRVGP